MNRIRAFSRALTTLTFVAVAALLMAACGSDDKSPESTTATGGGTTAATTSTTATGGGTNTAVKPGSCKQAPGSSAKTYTAEPPMTMKAGDKVKVTLQTSEGNMQAEIDASAGIHAANNFVFLAKEGFYHCIPFHRIIKGFMLQTGDPTGTGTGDPGYSIPDDKVTGTYTRGVLAMANAGPNTGGSQFFIVHAPDAGLPPSYAIFGKVTGGLDVIDKIANVPVEASDSGENSAPTKDVWLENVIVG